MKFRRKTAALLAVTLLTGLVYTGPVYAASQTETNGDVLTYSEDSLIEEVIDGDLISDEEADELLTADDEDTEGLKIYECSDDACDSLNAKLNEGEMMAVLYLCDTYPLRSAPSVSASAVTDLPSGTTLYLKSVSYAEGTYWFYAGAYLTEEETTGYIPMDKLVSIDRGYLDWEQTLTASFAGGISSDGAGASSIPGKARESVYKFPDSYRDSLLKILGSHPNWVFVPQKVDSTLEEAVNAQYEDKNRNWVYYTVNDSYKGGKINSTWYYASKTGLKYYMNPANFVGSEQNIFMFEQLTYNASYQTESGVQSVLGGTFMSGNIPGEGKTYAAAFNEIGSRLKVSPYHLAARVYQEQGQGTSPLISGTYSGYEGYYNYFNIQATGSSNSEIYRNGLSYAKNQGWDTRYKSLEGGAKFDSKNYILAGQDTPYLEKYNVVKKTYWHQYMQNASAPLTEAKKVYSMYKNSGALNNPFVFKIPVYNGDKISPAPPIKPDCTIKNTKKSNLYYTIDTEEAAALFKIEASEDIEEICLSPEREASLREGTRPYYDIDSFNPATGILKLKPVLLENNNYGTVIKKVYLDITFKEYGQISYKITVPVINKAPSIKVKGDTLYNGVWDGSLGLTAADLPSDVSVSISGTGLTASLNGDRTAVLIHAEGPIKGGSRKAIFSSDSWRAPVKKTVTVKYVKKPASVYTFSTSGKIKLSKNDSYIKYTPKMSSFPGLTVEEVSVEGDFADLFEAELVKKDDLLPNGKKVTGRGGAILLRAKADAELVVGSKYKTEIRSKLSNGLEIVKTVTVKPAK